MRESYQRQSGRGYIDAENQEWFSLPQEMRMAILLVAKIDGNLQELAGRDMREAGDALMEQGEKRNDVYRARTAVQKFLEELLEEEDDDE